MDSEALKNMSVEELAVHQRWAMEQRMPKYMARLDSSPEELASIRQRRLREILGFAKQNYRWYKNSLAHIDPDTFTEDRLAEIPILTRDLLMENWNDIVTDDAITLKMAEAHLARMRSDPDVLHLNNTHHVLATGGSTGARGVFVYTLEEWNEKHIYWARHDRYRFLKGGKAVPTTKLKLAHVIMENAVWGAYAMARTFQYETVDQRYFPMNLPLGQICAGLNDMQPDMLFGTSTTVFRLCREAEAGNLRIQPGTIKMAGEALYPPIRQLVEEVWPDAEIFNVYGSSEGLSAFNCEANSLEMHLTMDNCIVEPIDEHYAPTPPGELSAKILHTNLYFRTQPLIRYEITDRLQFLQKDCDCGIRHQLIAEPQGRPEFDFNYEGGVFVHHLIFITTLLLQESVREYQVRQTENGADITLVCTGEVDHEQLTTELIEKLESLGLQNPVVTTQEVDAIAYPDSGKLRRFLPLNHR